MNQLPGVEKNISLAEHTTFRIGGPAALFYEAKTTSDLIRATKVAKQLKIPYFILGGGSNLLVSDQGFQGLVIKIRNSQFAIRNSILVAEAGTELKTLVEKSRLACLSGLEFAAGIPGTLGGAIRGNAGAWQQSVGDHVLRVKVLTPADQVKWLNQQECQFAYRQSRFKKTKEIILAAELQLKKGSGKAIEAKIKANLEKRQTQPKEPSAGCIFVNPKPMSAGKLIEGCGLKGKRIGDAQISPRHANFIVNLGQAKANEILQLIKLAKEKVGEKYGVELKEEISLLGFDKI